MIVLPAMDRAQEAAWHALLDLYDKHPDDWTLIGGQLVHLHCAERGYSPQRPTNDADAVVNARIPSALGAVTAALKELKFEPDPSADDVQHRWINGDAVIDVLIPEGTGERTSRRKSASGFPTVAAPGGSQALKRTEIVEVQIGSRTGRVPRPTLLSAMILKAAAYSETTGSGRKRHCHDFAALAAILAASDTGTVLLDSKDRKRLRKMITATLALPAAIAENPTAERRLARLSEAIDAK
ncbi:hypothetical protein [Nocardioides sp. WS12]|uniref:hypothetical protein n=1 Tax=Nocardioides sp. WS12 TaxID=2486272 RepID=UPI0015FE6929|nr:hypothetical protein [Nocardioides sp. WS12]